MSQESVVWPVLSVSIAVAQALASGICAVVLYRRSTWRGAPAYGQLDSLITHHPTVSQFVESTRLRRHSAYFRTSASSSRRETGEIEEDEDEGSEKINEHSSLLSNNSSSFTNGKRGLLSDGGEEEEEVEEEQAVLNTELNDPLNDEEQGGGVGTMEHYRKLSVRRERKQQKKQASLLVLPVYYRLMFLQALHCFLWAGVAIYVVAQGDNMIEWGESSESRISVQFIVITSILLGVHTAVLDGVLLFLFQQSVGSRSIVRSAQFSIVWAILNALFLCVVTSVAGLRTDFDKLKFNVLPWWDPFFMRTCSMFVFNLALLSFHFLVRNHCYAKNSPRKSWIALSAYNSISSLILIGVYLSDFFAESVGDWWATLVISGFVLFFLSSTPVFYFTLTRDSSYWRDLWRGEIENLGQEGRWGGGGAAAARAHGLLDSNAFSYDKVLGSGGFATVWRGKLWEEIPVAVKVLHIKELSTEVVEAFISEVKTLSLLDHPNVVGYLGACLNPPDLVIAMELCDLMSLQMRIINHAKERERERIRREAAAKIANNNNSSGEKKGNETAASVNADPGAQTPGRRARNKDRHTISILFSDQQVSQMCLAVCSALEFMHGRGVLHRDLKPANVLFDRFSGVPKVCDFGLAHWEVDSDVASPARSTKSSTSSNTTQGNPPLCGTPGYIPPEVLLGAAPTPSSDVFSLGIIIWEMLSGKLAFRGPAGYEKPKFLPIELMDGMAHRNLRPSLRELKRRMDGSEHVESDKTAVVVVESNIEDSGENNNNNNKKTTKTAIKSENARIVDPHLYDLMTECWHKDPHQRPSVTEIIRRLKLVSP